jgi:hypothetical protein
MTRKIKEETSKAAKTKKPSKEEKKAPESKEQETNPMDFGGIPNRNLKKNLGCG